MRKTNYWFGFVMLLLAIGLSGYITPNAWSMDKQAYKNIYVYQFEKLMDQKDFTLINVHIPYQGEIAGTDLLIPFNAIDQHKNRLPNNKDARIIVYCMAGHMGYIAAEKLTQMGYTRVIHFKGGMRAWAENSKQIVSRRN
ncbi:MAG: rhodanese-like domain-containing protein [Desulfobacteraceae bacterium]|nr:rhodanese-like domain-containing protein [Desulfobacteraceae bacterium]